MEQTVYNKINYNKINFKFDLFQIKWKDFIIISQMPKDSLPLTCLLNVFLLNGLSFKRFGYTETFGVPCGWRSTFGCARRRYWIYARSAWIDTWLWPDQSVILR